MGLGLGCVVQMNTLYDVVSRVAVHRMGWEEEFEDGNRPHWLILNGMLLQVGVRIVEAGPPPKPGSVRAKKLETDPDELPDLSVKFPDICCLDELAACGPYSVEELQSYMVRFTDAVIPLLKLSGSESEVYIRANLGRVIDHLAQRLIKGRLRFYNPRYGKSPEKNGALVFLDLSNPADPTFLYPLFGLRDGYTGQCRWTPCPNETQKLEPQPEIEWTAEMLRELRAVPTLDTFSSDGEDGFSSDGEDEGF